MIRNAETIRSQLVERLLDLCRQKCLPGVAQQALERFLASDGMRGIEEINLGKPRWQEEPIPTFFMLKGFLQLDNPELASDRTYLLGTEQVERMILDDPN